MTVLSDQTFEPYLGRLVNVDELKQCRQPAVTASSRPGRDTPMPKMGVACLACPSYPFGSGPFSSVTERMRTWATSTTSRVSLASPLAFLAATASPSMTRQ